jgi:glycosyltransferase involved in cell wall biosynthesis
MTTARHANVLIVRGWPGQPGPEELTRKAAAGERPRTLYVELGRALGADILDANELLDNGAAISRLVGRTVGMLEGQVVEAFIRRRRYRHIVAFADRIGLELALLLKAARSRRDLALVSSRIMGRAKRPYLERFHVQSHLGPIISYSSVQLDLAAEHYGLPRESLHVELQPVDEHFWHPLDTVDEPMICSVGCISGYRDYATLVAAVRDLPVRVELAIGNLNLSAAQQRSRRALIESKLPAESLPENVRYSMELGPRRLRDLYARARFVVMPLEDVDFDAGVTAITEAMAMGKAVIVTSAKGQVDVIRDGVDGIYVPPNDPRALREAITHLLDNPAEAARLGAAGRAAVLERHTLDDYCRRVAELVFRAGAEADSLAQRLPLRAPLRADEQAGGEPYGAEHRSRVA